MTEQKFFRLDVLGDANDQDLLFINRFVEGINPESWRLHKGEPLAPVYPKDARLIMDDETGGLRLASLIGNTNAMLLVSSQFRRLIEEACVGVPVEYLPVGIYDHRNRLLTADYHIVNPLGTYDCLDFKKTDVTWDDEHPNEIIAMKGHVLDRAKVKDAPQLFRMGRDPARYVVGRQLARAMYDAKLTNIMWRQLPFND